MSQWKPLGYETLKWEINKDISTLSRRSISKILPTYKSSLPNMISDKNITIDPDFEVAITDLLIKISRFDTIQSAKGYSFPTALLRSESAASSQIENLTSSIRNIAIAELDSKSTKNAQIIANNVAAMRTAINTTEMLSISTIQKIHNELMKSSKTIIPGEFRTQAVWIGGSPYSPHKAIFVPPHYTHIKNYMDDLILYAGRIDVNPIVKAAILHAQFETIHPFIDGNGRTGRALIHKSLKDDDVLKTVALPISAGLLNNTKDYMSALLAFQDGNPIPIIEQVFNALELALVIGSKASEDISLVINEWEETLDEKKTSSMWDFLYLLIQQPVVNSTYLSNKLDLSVRGANLLINRAVDLGILRRIGNQRRGILYQADDIIEIMDKISDIDSIKRLIA